MRTYYIFNVNKYFAYMYKDKPFKMYKIFEEIYYSRNYGIAKTYTLFEGLSFPFDKRMLDEYIFHEYKNKYGYKKSGNTHYINANEKTTLVINNYTIKVTTSDNYTSFFSLLNNYNDSLFICDFNNKDYFWLSKLKPLQKEVSIVK